jgi:predicted ribonuclease toxin of YeeF-YezG toxin-antitoxin module
VVETVAGKKPPAPAAVSEGAVSGAPVRLTTTAERVRENPMLMKQYVQHMEKITELKLHPVQTEKLKEVLRSTKFEKLTTEASDAHRAIFDKVKSKLRKEWEMNTGQKWPTYEIIVEQDGVKKIIKKYYDAHHIIQSSHKGPNEWWNIHPAHGLDHHPKIHAKGAPARQIFAEPTKKGGEQ